MRIIKNPSFTLVACVALLLCACGKSQTDPNVSNADRKSELLSPLPQEQIEPVNEEPTIDITEQIRKLEYSIVLSAAEEATRHNPISWALYDGDQDGSDELYVDATYIDLPAGEWGGLCMLADADNESLWASSVAGSFGGVEWKQMSDSRVPQLFTYHISAGSPLRRYFYWEGNSWAIHSELYRNDSGEIVCFWDGEAVTLEQFQQKENEYYLPEVNFDSPKQYPIIIDGQPKAVINVFDEYWQKRVGFLNVVSGDVDGDGQKESLYCINSAFQLWKDRMHVYEGGDSLDGWNDNAITILIVDQEESQTQVSIARIPTLGNELSCENGKLIIDGIQYIYDGETFARDQSDDNGEENEGIPSQTPVSDEDFLRLANEQVVEQYNFVYYLDVGAAFEQEWSNSSNDSANPWYRVVDERIHSLQDIKNIWYSYFSKTSVMPDEMLHAYKEMNGAVYTRNEGVGDNFVGIQLNRITERTNSYVLIQGDQLFVDPWGDGNVKTGDITYKMVMDDGEWKCEEILLNGKAWAFVDW